MSFFYDWTRLTGAAWIILAALASATLTTVGASAQSPATAPASTPSMVELNFPENVELKVLIDYMGKRQGINFIYDEQIGNKKVTIKAPQKVPAESLNRLMESVLAMKGLSVVATEVPGTMRVELAKALTATASGPTTLPAGADVPLAVTRVFELKYASAGQVDLVLKPFLSASTANLTPLPEHGLVIITDYSNNMKRLEDLLAVIDRPRRDVQVRFVPINNLESAMLATKVTQLLAGKAKARGGETAKDGAGDVSVFADERTNQVVVIGSVQAVSETLSLVQSLDVPLGLETKVYTFTSASPERADRLVKDLIGEAQAKRLYKSAIDRESNVLIVTTTPVIHRQVEAIHQTLDKPQEDLQNPIRFYKLENAKAVDVLTTLQGIEGETGMGGVSIDGVAAEQGRADDQRPVITGPNQDEANNGPPPGAEAPNGKARPRSNSVNLRDARVMADEPSNMIIVVAKPSMHPVYEKLIKRLDVRRPQVLIEATVVTIDTTDDFELGVEILQNRSFDNGSGRIIGFSSFGLTDVDPTKGGLTLRPGKDPSGKPYMDPAAAMTLNPGVGFNGVLLSSDIANVVVHALAKDSRARVMSRPNILINDNAKATLVSEQEEPFASVNASTTVATTSFAGYSSAGTSIIVKPQISEGEHLKLEYEITLSSFDDNRTETLPPSRQRNTLTSEVTIPDGDTIVVGGLSRDSKADAVDRVPGLGQIPVLEYLFSSRSTRKRKSTLFVFMRAVILRDDKFQDLKVISAAAAARAGLCGAYPVSQPLEVQ